MLNAGHVAAAIVARRHAMPLEHLQQFLVQTEGLKKTCCPSAVLRHLQEYSHG
jgi:hypothetical protein